MKRTLSLRILTLLALVVMALCLGSVLAEGDCSKCVQTDDGINGCLDHQEHGNTNCVPEEYGGPCVVWGNCELIIL